MKVILKSEVDNVGLPGEVVEVADGYGRNFLLPRGMAILATKGAMKEAAAITRSRKAQEAKTLGAAEASKQALEARTLRIEARVDERGHLYGSVSIHDIARVLRERGHDIPAKRIELRGTFKEIGTYEVPVRVHPQVTATVAVEVADVEGVVGVEPTQVDSDEVAEAAAEAAEGSETDTEVLAEQALEAAEEYEQHRAGLEAERQAADRDVGTDQESEVAVTEGADEE